LTVISIIIPTHNNADVLEECLSCWHRWNGSVDFEVIVVEDGCSDRTPDLLRLTAATTWGRAHLRWVHEPDVHELRSTNRGIAEARGDLLLVWQDDMFVERAWFLPELARTFGAIPELGLLSLSRGLFCNPLDEPIDRPEDLVDWRRLESTIGPSPLNWAFLHEVDAVVRPWMVRRAAIERVGPLDPAFRLSEWDEADLAFRIRQAGWAVATHGFERLGAYRHLGSTTIQTPSEAYRRQVLANGRLFHDRWDSAIRAARGRVRRRWRRRASAAGWLRTIVQCGRYGLGRAGLVRLPHVHGERHAS
jgi:glycosyltransferase involved in cell wall biosynthesis